MIRVIRARSCHTRVRQKSLVASPVTAVRWPKPCLVACLRSNRWWAIVGGQSLVGSRGLEPRTSAVEGPKRCADRSAKIEMVDPGAGWYQDDALGRDKGLRGVIPDIAALTVGRPRSAL